MSKIKPDLTDFCPLESQESRHRSDHILKILFSDSFLIGLGRKADQATFTNHTKITSSIIEAIKLSGDQEMMKTSAPWTHQNFIDQFPNAPVAKEISDGVYRFVESLDDYISSVSQKNSIQETNYDLVEQLGASEETINTAVEYILIDYLPLILNDWLLSIFYVDQNILSFWDQVSVCFALGGLPCGWLGPVGFNEGGLPSECMIMLHRKYLDGEREILFSNIKEPWP